METTVTKEQSGAKITVKAIREVDAKTAYADGWNVDLGKRTYETVSVTVQKGGKEIYCSDLNFFYKLTEDDRRQFDNPLIFARLGDAYIGEEIYSLICEAVKEAKTACQGDAEYAEVKAAETAEKDKKEKGVTAVAKLEAERAQHPGWCNKCHSYCYGDCEAS